MPGPPANVKVGSTGPQFSNLGLQPWLRTFQKQQPSRGGDWEPGWWWWLSISALLCWASHLSTTGTETAHQRPPMRRHSQIWKERRQLTWKQQKWVRGTGETGGVGALTGPAAPKTPASGDRENVTRIWGQVQTWLSYKCWKCIILCPDLKYGSLYLPSMSVSEIIRFTPW